MAHLFISYSRADRPSVEKLSGILEAAGHSVWWDRHIRGGAAFAKDIENQLEKSDAVIVVWSPNANESDWVKDEAVYARDEGKLIPICLEGCDTPIGFRQYQTIDFDKWKGAPDAEPVQALLAAVAEKTNSASVPPPVMAAKSLQQKLVSEPVYMAGVGAALLVIAVATFLLLSGPKDDPDATQLAERRVRHSIGGIGSFHCGPAVCGHVARRQSGIFCGRPF